MRAVHIVAPGQPEFVEVPVPLPGPGQALVRPRLVALCGSDVRVVFYSPREEYPFAVGRNGHEIIARVEALNGHLDGVQVGDLVLALIPGELGMAEYCVTGLDNLLPLPPGKPLEHLLMAQQLGTVIYASKRLPNVVGQDGVVIGQGSAGLFFDALLRRLGMERVIALDVKDARLDAALQLGATHVVNNERTDPLAAVQEITGSRLADLVVEAAGEPETINLMPHLVKQNGCLFSFGVPRGPHSFMFDYFAMFRKRCHWVSSDGTVAEPGRASIRQALGMIARGEIDVSPLVTHRFPFERVCEAYELARSRDDGAVKVVVEMPD
jgi:L-iditol 2-dehydrogenase